MPRSRRNDTPSLRTYANGPPSASPNRPLIIALGAAAGLGLGLLMALGLELLRRPVRSPRQIQDLGLPMIGVVPLLKTKTKSRSGRLPAFFSREKRFAA